MEKAVVFCDTAVIGRPEAASSPTRARRRYLIPRFYRVGAFIGSTKSVLEWTRCLVRRELIAEVFEDLKLAGRCSRLRCCFAFPIAIAQRHKYPY